MSNFLSNRAKDLKQGAIRAMFDRAKLFNDVISLGIGEPDLDTPLEIVEAGCDALKSGKTHYTPNAGIIQLRQKISEYLVKFGVSADPERNIIVTTGAMGALSLCLLTVLNQGDEVLIQDPQWLNYYAQVKFAGGIPVPIPVYEDDEFKLKAEDIEKRITDKTKVLIINSPNNPTGAVLNYEDLKAIAEVAIKNDLLVISDEVYHTLIYDGNKHYSIGSIEGMQERTIVINSFSKAFAMTGWRVGFAAGNSKIIDKMVKLQENLVACVNSSAQYAAIKALELSEISNDIRDVFLKRRDFIVRELNKIEGISCLLPKGSFYVFANIKDFGKKSEDIANELLEKAGVITIPGSAFGEYGEGYLRIAYTVSEEKLKEAIERIKKYVNENFKQNSGVAL